LIFLNSRVNSIVPFTVPCAILKGRDQRWPFLTPWTIIHNYSHVSIIARSLLVSLRCKGTFKVYMARFFLFWKSIIYEVNSGMFQYFVIWASHLRVMLIRWRQVFFSIIYFYFFKQHFFSEIQKKSLTSCRKVVENFLPDQKCQ